MSLINKKLVKNICSVKIFFASKKRECNGVESDNDLNGFLIYVMWISSLLHSICALELERYGWRELDKNRCPNFLYICILLVMGLQQNTYFLSWLYLVIVTKDAHKSFESFSLIHCWYKVYIIKEYFIK